MNESTGQTNGWLWLTLPIAPLLMLAAGSGVFVSGLYRDTPNFAAQAVGQDLVSLFVVLPTLLISAFLAKRGSTRARLVWLGVMVYLVYSYVIAAFDARFNSLFLVYVALLGCSLFALIGGLATSNTNATKTLFTDKTPVNTVSIYLGILAVLFYALWLSEIVPALLSGTIPQSVVVNGTPTNSVHVLDMVWVLPSLLLTAVGLRRHWALAYTLAGMGLTYLVLLSLAVISMVVSMLQAGQAVTAPEAAIFATLFVTSLGMLVWYLRGLHSPAVRRERSLPAWGAS